MILHLDEKLSGARLNDPIKKSVCNRGFEISIHFLSFKTCIPIVTAFRGCINMDTEGVFLRNCLKTVTFVALVTITHLIFCHTSQPSLCLYLLVGSCELLPVNNYIQADHVTITVKTWVRLVL